MVARANTHVMEEPRIKTRKAVNNHGPSRHQLPRFDVPEDFQPISLVHEGDAPEVTSADQSRVTDADLNSGPSKRAGEIYQLAARCQVERSLLWKITRSLIAVDNDLRVRNQLLYYKPKIINKTNCLQSCPY